VLGIEELVGLDVVGGIVGRRVHSLVGAYVGNDPLPSELETYGFKRK